MYKSHTTDVSQNSSPPMPIPASPKKSALAATSSTASATHSPPNSYSSTTAWSSLNSTSDEPLVPGHRRASGLFREGSANSLSSLNASSSSSSNSLNTSSSSSLSSSPGTQRKNQQALIQTIFNEEIQIEPSTKRIIIIGAGMGGCCTALELADAGYQVTLVDKSEPLSITSSSNSTPGRLGVGVHYPHMKTAREYLTATIKFVRKFSNPEFIAGGADVHHPLNRGHYFIATQSEYSDLDAHELFKGLKAAYKDLIAQDPANQIFGDPEDFFKPMSVSSYAGFVNPEQIKYGLETAERTLNWPLLKAHILEKIEEYKRLGKITVHNSTYVTSISQNQDLQFIVTAKQGENSVAYPADAVINAAWTGIDKINQASGYSVQPVSSRVKAMVTVAISAEDIGKHNHSAFICYGPFASFTIAEFDPDTQTYICHVTSELQTNLGIVRPGEQLSDELQDYIDGKASEATQRMHGTAILEGASVYIPLLKDPNKVKFIKTSYGVVRTFGTLPTDVYGRNSNIHRRDGDNIRSLQTGVKEHPCMKLMFAVSNGEKIKNSLPDDFKWLEKIKKLAGSSYKHGKLLARLLCKYWIPDDLDNIVKENLFQDLLEKLSDVVQTSDKILEPNSAILKIPKQLDDYIKNIKTEFENSIAISRIAEAIANTNKTSKSQLSIQAKVVNEELHKHWELAELNQLITLGILKLPFIQQQIYKIFSKSRASNRISDEEYAEKIASLKEMLQFYLSIKEKLASAQNFTSELLDILFVAFPQLYREENLRAQIQNQTPVELEFSLEEFIPFCQKFQQLGLRNPALTLDYFTNTFSITSPASPAPSSNGFFSGTYNIFRGFIMASIKKLPATSNNHTTDEEKDIAHSHR